MNGGYKEIVQETGNYQEILNTVVGSKVYYMFQEEVYKALKDPNNIELGNKIALDETLQFLWVPYLGCDVSSNITIADMTAVWGVVCLRLDKLGLKVPNFIEADTFEEFLDKLKEMKLEKSSQILLRGYSV